MKSKYTRLIITAIVVILLVLWHPKQPAIAQPGVDSRVSRLEAEIMSLRGQVNQLQTHIARLSNSGGSAPRIEAPEPQYIPQNSISKSMFDRLATLVIELKERMDSIDQRVRVLEGR